MIEQRERDRWASCQIEVRGYKEGSYVDPELWGVKEWQVSHNGRLHIWPAFTDLDVARRVANFACQTFDAGQEAKQQKIKSALGL